MIHPCKFPREFIHSVPDDYHLIITVTKIEDYVTLLLGSMYIWSLLNQLNRS